MSSLGNNLLVNSKEVIEKTGISRATLNNYIKLGILPRPLIKKPEGATIRAKKIGYFPQEIIENIEIVKRMKREGYSIKDIAKKLDNFSTVHSTGKEDLSAASPLESDSLSITTKKVNERRKDTIENTLRETDEGLKLTISDLHCPAYLLNQRFEIQWISKEAEDQIFHHDIHSIRETRSRSVFKLFLNMEMYNNDHNKNDLLEFHMLFVKSRHTKESLAELYEGISKMELHVLEKIYDRVCSEPGDPIKEAYLNLAGFDGIVRSYRAYRVVFREGILFVYVPVDNLLDGVIELLSYRKKVLGELLQQRIPTLVSFCVLIADLQDSVKICANLPPEEYFLLINQLWKYMEDTFRKYYGVYGKHTGDGIVYYFMKDTNSDYLTNSIYCALELREKVKKLSMEWKMRKGWFHDLYLNIGINEGQEYLSHITPSPGIEFTALGDSVNCTGRLSDFARYGAIWATKNLINKLNVEDRKKIRFGIRRKDNDREKIVENMFFRVMDLLAEDNSRSSKFMDIATISVAEIIDLI
ncbi:MAG: adenylate/guanylate cyclase domain-containing protein [Syntrophales bacterium]